MEEIWPSQSDQPTRKQAQALLTLIVKSGLQVRGFAYHNHPGVAVWHDRMRKELMLLGKSMHPKLFNQVHMLFLRMGKETVDEWEAIYHRKRTKFRRPKHRRFDLIIPLNFDLSPKKVLYIDGKRFTILSKQGFEAEFDQPQIVEQLSRNFRPLQLTNTAGAQEEIEKALCFLRIEEYAENGSAAWDKIEPAYEIFRGVFDHFMTEGKIEMHLGWIRKRTKFPHPRWLVVVISPLL